MSANPIVWWELATHDAEKTVQFFRAVFEWQIQFDEKAGFFKMHHNPPAISGGGEWIGLFNEPSGVTFAMIQQAKPA